MKFEFKKLAREDLPFLNEVRRDCVNYLHDPRQFTLKETIEWFYSTNPMFWIILLDGERVGYFRTSRLSIENKNIYLGADLHDRFRGKGLGYQAYKEFMPILFDDFDLHKISLEVLETNTRAITLYEKLGFKYEGARREEVFKGGAWVNSIIMSLLKKEINENM